VKKENDNKDKKCYRCGNVGHFASNKDCTAWGAKCNKCKGKNHFSSVCKTKLKTDKEERKNRVRNLNEIEDLSNDNEEFAFGISIVEPNVAVVTKQSTNRLPVDIGGINMEVMIDSGAECNIMGREYWEYLKKNKVKCKSHKISKILYPYGQDEPLKILGKFETTVMVSGNGKSLENVEFYVLNGKGIPLLGKKTSEDLKVLKIGLDVNTVKQYPEDCASLKQIFEGLGKLKDFKLKIPIKDDVIPISQPARRIPYQLRKVVESKIAELLKNDIIERVEGPTSWCSPVVIVPKKKWRHSIMC
jgi:hypothetical protein